MNYVRDAREGIAEVIHQRGFKQTVIAQKAGLTPQQLSDIISKRRKMDANEMFALCAALGTSMESLFATSYTEPPG